MGCKNLPKNSTVLEASVSEIAQAYFEALQRRDLEGVLFWRFVLLERLVMLRAALADSERASNVSGDEPAGC